jgi:magnesium-transporting ATPase (P-type)
LIVLDLSTNILPAISLAYEAEEESTMERPPRRVDDHLVTIPMICFTYLTVGALQCLAAYFGFFYVFLDLGFDFSRLFGAAEGFRLPHDEVSQNRKQHFRDMCLDMPKYLARYGDPSAIRDEASAPDSPICGDWFSTFRVNALQQAQSAYYITVVYGQFANVLVKKTFLESVLNWHRLTNNPAVFAAMGVSMAVALIVMLLPGLNTIFNFRLESAEYFFVTSWYIIVVVAFDETRKAILRRMVRSPSVTISDEAIAVAAES